MGGDGDGDGGDGGGGGGDGDGGDGCDGAILYIVTTVSCVVYSCYIYRLLMTRHK